MITITEYDPTWPETFAAQAELLRGAAPAAISNVHHVGSTAVPGLSARPVVDILIDLKRPLDEGEIKAFKALGFEFKGDMGIPACQHFVRSEEPPVTIYAFPAVVSAGMAMRHFRNHLIARPEAMAEFDAAKRRVEAEHSADAAAFERAHDALLLEYDKKAAMWAAAEERRKHEEALHRPAGAADDDDDDDGEIKGIGPV